VGSFSAATEELLIIHGRNLLQLNEELRSRCTGAISTMMSNCMMRSSSAGTEELLNSGQGASQWLSSSSSTTFE